MIHKYDSLANFMQDYGVLLSNDEVDCFFIACDLNNDKVIDFEEFSTLF